MIPRSEDFLYIIQCQATGAIKVGRSIDPDARLRQLQTGCPTELKVWWRISGAAFLESWFHDLFADECMRGEWYPKGSTAELTIRNWKLAPYRDTAALVETFGRAVEKGIEYSKDSNARWLLPDALVGGRTEKAVRDAWDYAKERAAEWEWRCQSLEVAHESLFDKTIHGKQVAPPPASKIPGPTTEEARG